MSNNAFRALQRAIKAVGASAELARRLGVSRQAVDQWKKVPATRAVDVERETGIPRYELRPDVFPADGK